MLKKSRKILCLLISLIIIFSSLCISTSAGEKCDCGNAPVIYIKGRGSIYEDKHSMDSKCISQLDSETLAKYLPELVANYYICYKKDDFTSFSHKLASVLYKCLEGYQFDENGNVQNDSGRLPYYRWKECLYEQQGEDLTYDEWLKYRVTPEHNTFTDMNLPLYLSYNDIYQHPYNFDPREDPCQIADDLNEYIEYIKELTGHDKVKIVCRCLGTSIFSAYLCKYGYDSIDSVVFYNPLYNGSVLADNIFTGKLYIDADSVDNIANEYLDDNIMLSVLAKVVSLANSTYNLDMTADYFNKTLVKVGQQAFPEALLATYATCPGYWTMVSSEAYEEARDFVFNGVEDKYAGLINKLDNYHNNVALKINDVIKQMDADGVNVFYIAKYNCQMYPIVSKEDSAINGDNVISVSQQAPGTVAADIGTTLSESYIAEQTEKGLGKYISYDKTIDASGTIVPDRTWYIKDLDHNNYSDMVEYLIATIMQNSETFDVNSSEMFPQFMTYESEDDDTEMMYKLSENHPGKSYEKKTFIEILKDLFMLIIDALIFWK